MGNVNGRIWSEGRRYTFVGREPKIKKIVKDIRGENKLVVQIHGMQEIGTSHLLTQILKIFHEERKCILVESISLNSRNIKRMLFDLQKKLNLKMLLEPEELEKLPSLTTVIDEVVKKIETLDEPTLLFVDDAHKIPDEQFKTYFLHFLNKVCNSQTSNFKVIFTGSEKVRLMSKAFSDHNIGKMSSGEIRKLFVSVINEKGASDNDGDDEEDHGEDNDEDDGEDDNAEVSLASMILSKSNKKFIDALVELCAGLPKVAIMLGSELTANNGLLEPKDMVVLIIKDCVHTLSPECYPDLDKAETYKKPLQNLKERRELIEAFNSKMGTDNTAVISDIVDGIPGTGSTAEAKEKTRRIVDNNVMRYELKNKKFTMPPIYRDCILAMKSLLTEEDEEIKKVLQKGRLQLAQLPGAPEGIANDTRKLEEFLNSLEGNNDNDSQGHQQMDCPRQVYMDKEVIYFRQPYSPEKLLNNHTGKEICSICHRPFTIYDNYVDNVNMDTCTCSKMLSEKNTNSGFDSISGPHALGPVSSGEYDNNGDTIVCNNLGRICNRDEFSGQAMDIRSLNIGGENKSAKCLFEASNEAYILDSREGMNGSIEVVDQGIEQGEEEGSIQDTLLAAETMTNGIETKTEGSTFLEVQKSEAESQVQRSQEEVNFRFDDLNLNGEREASTLEVPERLENGGSGVKGLGDLGNKPEFMSPDTGLPRSLNDSD